MAAELLPQFLIRIAWGYANGFPILLQLFDRFNRCAQVFLLNQLLSLFRQRFLSIQVAVVLCFQVVIDGVARGMEIILSFLVCRAINRRVAAECFPCCFQCFLNHFPISA